MRTFLRPCCLFLTSLVLASFLTRASPLTWAATTDDDDTSACDRFDDLPDECLCVEKAHHRLQIECLKEFNDGVFFQNDTVGILLDWDICNPSGSQLDIDLVEYNHNISYNIAGIHAGDEEDYPIPGWSVIVPGIGHVGMDVAVAVAGNPDMLSVDIGLTACAVLRTHTLCAESIPGLNLLLPWYILHGTYSFGDWCETAAAAVAML